MKLTFSDQTHLCNSLWTVFLVVALWLCSSPNRPLYAQVTTAITPTAGAGNLGTTVTPNGNMYNIGGGTRPSNGANLFHSFGEFNVGTGDIANFTNATPALPTSNILGRVTGGNPSNIFGTIQTIEFPGANLFLMNPAGIVFGPTAQLNVSGTVNFTTTDYLRLADQTGGNAGIFYASPSFPSVLTSSPVAAFGFLTASPSPITVQGSTLEMSPNNTVAFIGGDVTFTADPGSGAPATVRAPGGQIQVVSVASQGEVLTPSLTFGPNINGQSFSTLGTTMLQGGAILDTSDLNLAGNGSAGSIVIRGGRLVMDSGLLLAEHSNDADAASPAIKVIIDGNLEMRNLSGMLADTYALGRSGDIQVSAHDIQITDGSRIVTGTFLSGQAGDISVTATESISIRGIASDPFLNEPRSRIQSISEFSSGNSGSIFVKTPLLAVADRGLIETHAFDVTAGDIQLEVQNLALTGGGGIASSGGFLGPSGSITVHAEGTVSILGEYHFDPSNPPGFETRSRILTENLGLGGTGTILVETGKLIVTDGAFLRSETQFSEGSLTSPKVTILAHDSISISGLGQQGGGSSIGVFSADSDIGGLDISARTITLTDRATIDTFTAGDGNAGSLTIRADSFFASGGSQVRSRTQSSFGFGKGGEVLLAVTDRALLTGTHIDEQGQSTPTAIISRTNGHGDAGSVTITARELNISDGAQVDSSSARSATGNAGRVSLTASTVTVESGGLVTSSTEASGQGGTVEVNAQQVNIATGGRITSNSKFATPRFPGDIPPTPTGSAGAVTIQGLAGPAESVLIDGVGSGIFTNTEGTGAGGNINVNAQTLTLQNQGTFSAATSGGAPTATGGTITVNAHTVDMSSGAGMTTDTSGPGQGGSVTINAGSSISLTDSAISSNSTFFEPDAGSGGQIHLNSPAVALNHSVVSASTAGPGNAGSVLIETGQLVISDSQVLTSTQSSGLAGVITIHGLTGPESLADLVMLSGSSRIGSDSIGGGGQEGDAGNITIGTKTLALTESSRISSNSEFSPGNAGNLVINATEQLTVSSGSEVSSNSLFGKSGNAGNISVTGQAILLTDGGRLSTITEGSGKGGTITVIPNESLVISGTNTLGVPSGIFTTTSGEGPGGNIIVNGQTATFQNQGTLSAATSSSATTATGGEITINVSDFQVGAQGLVTTETTGSGMAGNISVVATSAQLSDNGTVSARTTGPGDAGAVNIQSSGNYVMNGGTVSTSATEGQGGNILVGAGQQIQMSNNALISASSTGPKNAGNIQITAGDSIFLNESAITATASQASGGDIKLTAPNTVELVNSVISTSVQFGSSTEGGNINIDPQLVILQNSQILANAVEGNGGNILIIANLFLQDGTSIIDASSQKGISGSVNIQSPISNLSQVVNPLPRSALQAATLLHERCAVRAQSGNLSSLTVRSREVAPVAPGGMLSGPLISIGPSPAASGASPTQSQQSAVTKPALLEISGEILRPLAGRGERQLGGCGS